MKSTMNGMVLSVLMVSLLAACGGGGGGGTGGGAGGGTGGGNPAAPGAPVAGTPTATTATALAAIQTQLNVFQGRFATVMPAATDPALVALLDATFLNNGLNAATFLTNQTGQFGFPIGATFAAPIGANPPDAGSVPNDATHQWFATTLKGGMNGGGVQYFRLLAIKNAAGQWLLAGNQRQVGVFVNSFAWQEIQPAVAVGAAPVSIFFTGVNLAANTAQMATVTSATVSGPGLIGAVANTLGAVNLAGMPRVRPCGVPQGAPIATPAVTTNCMDVTRATAGTYRFNLVGTTLAGAAINASYNEVFVAVPPAPIAANFPVINSVAPATKVALVPGAAVSVNWTARAGQTPKGAGVQAIDLNLGTPLFFLNIPVVGAAAGATLTSSGSIPATPFPAGAVVGGVSVYVGAMDANGLMVETLKIY